MRSWFRDKSATTRPHYDKVAHQLSDNELYTATTIFNRARGHFQRLNIEQFRDTVLNEAQPGIPEYLALRLFRDWNVSCDGELSLSEFTAGVAAAVKSAQSDLMEMIFRMMSTNGDGSNVSRPDVARFLKCFDPGSNFMSVDRRETFAVSQPWAGDKLLRMLFGPSTTERLTLEKLRTVIVSSHSYGAIVEWIPNLGARLLSPQDDFVLQTGVIQRLTNFKLVHVRNNISSKQREKLRSELRTILFILSTDSPSLTSAYIIDRFRDVLDEDFLMDTIVTVWNIASTGNKPNSSESPAVREEFKLFVLGYCCAHAASVHQVYRLLFELFDEDSCGQLEVEQLSGFLQLAVDLSPIDSEREANLIIRRHGRSHSPSLSPPPSPRGLSINPSRCPQVLSLHQFIDMAQDLPGLSHAEIETAYLLFHLSQIRSGSSPHDIDDDHLLLMNLLDNYFSEKMTQSIAFCLLTLQEWQQLMDGIMNGLTNVSVAEILHQEAIILPSGHVMLALPIWLLVSYWHGMRRVAPRESLKFSANWASSIQPSRGAQTFLRGFWIRVSINFTSRDGFERVATIPQVIAFAQCTLRSVLNAALFQKGLEGRDEKENSYNTTICQCQVLVAQRNDAGEIKTLVQQGDPMIVSQDQFMSPLGSIIRSLFSSLGNQSTVNNGNLAFELRFSVVKIEQQDNSLKEQGLATGSNMPYNGLEFTISTLSKQRTLQPMGTIPRGLTNLGNTCFTNAVLQCLATTPLLQSHIIETEHQQELASSHSPASSRKPTIRPASNSLICALGELFVGIHPKRQGIANDERSLSPANVLGALSTHAPHMFDGNQQDAQEFLVCLLGYLGDALKRRPTLTQNGESSILSPRSHTVLANLFTSKDGKSTTDKLSSQICVGDSNGRHDRVVATEWWVSHIVNEPSVTNILLSGQFKSALICSHCTHQSARFEPFSSLQLPLLEDSTNFQLPNQDQRDLVVIVHFAESSRSLVEVRCPVRTVVQVNDLSTVADILTRLTVVRSKPGPYEYVVGSLEEYTIQNLLVSDRTGEQIHDKAPASMLPNPTHVFENFCIMGSGDDTAAPTTGTTEVYLRFVHRRTFLVPFYCTTPTRQALCGAPFVCSSICGALTGQALHQMVLQRFLLGHNPRSKPRPNNTDIFKSQTEGSAHHFAPKFVLRRVRNDGIACSRCNWSTGCRGCLIPPTASAAELLDLENCETIAIDWDTQLHPQDPSAFWWLQSYPTRDHPSYINYLRTKTHPLMKSLQSLCSTEHLDATCSQCQQSTPHTKQLSLWSLPPLLVLQLKRFELSTSNGNYQWRKLCHNVDFPVHDLDLCNLLSPIEGGHDDSEPCTDRCFADALDPRVRRGIEYLQNELKIPLTSASRSCTKYDLYAVVNHCGRGISSGHYTAHMRRPDESRWWLADDTVVTPLSEDELSPSATAYLLFYVRQDVASGATELSDLFPTESD